MGNLPHSFFELFQKSELGKFIPNFPLKYVITSTNNKGNAQFIFLCKPQKSSVNVCLMKMLKSTVTKKVIACFYNLGEGKF